MSPAQEHAGSSRIWMPRCAAAASSRPSFSYLQICYLICGKKNHPLRHLYPPLEAMQRLIGQSIHFSRREFGVRVMLASHLSLSDAVSRKICSSSTGFSLIYQLVWPQLSRFFGNDEEIQRIQLSCDIFLRRWRAWIGDDASQAGRAGFPQYHSG